MVCAMLKRRDFDGEARSRRESEGTGEGVGRSAEGIE
jgi:hypothetical protein